MSRVALIITLVTVFIVRVGERSHPLHPLVTVLCAVCVCQTVKSFLAEMISQDRGHIVTVSSAGGLFGINGLADYSASKAAAIAFHDSVRAELYAVNKTGVHMTLVCPFFIDTGMFDGCNTRSTHSCGSCHIV